MDYCSYIGSVGKHLQIYVKKYFTVHKYRNNVNKKLHESSTYLLYSAFQHSHIFTLAASCTLSTNVKFQSVFFLLFMIDDQKIERMKEI